VNEGQLITPTLRLVRILGKGGMGSVWVADHLTLRTQVAVKFMFVQFAQNIEFVRRFQAEAMAAAQIKSPHVAQVFDHGITSEGEPYIVMELLEGEDLRQRLKRTGPLSPAEFAPILTQVAKALTRAHQLGIVHRDIKPDNVYLANMGDDIHVKVLDFGIAKLGDEAGLGATSTGLMLGTPFYMSPEQLLSAKAVDFRSDLWSLAVVTYQALTRVRPFKGETVGALSVAVNAGVFPLPSAARPGISAAIDAWMERALKREPTERFSSAREMAEAFDRAVRDPEALPIRDSGTTGAFGRTEIRPTPAAPAPTLSGTSHTATSAKGRRAPLFIGLAMLGVAALGAGAYLRLATTGRAVAAAPVPPTQPLNAATAATTPPPPSPVLDLDEPAATIPSASASSSAVAPSTPPPATRATSTALATTKPPPASTAKGSDRPKGTARPKDTIGF
jgi:eukaryotic-like serine/threonine-protein kinase